MVCRLRNGYKIWRHVLKVHLPSSFSESEKNRSDRKRFRLLQKQFEGQMDKIKKDAVEQS